MKKIYEAPTIEISEFEVEDIIMESNFKSLGAEALESMETDEYNAAVTILSGAGYEVKRFGTDFKGWN